LISAFLLPVAIIHKSFPSNNYVNANGDLSYPHSRQSSLFIINISLIYPKSGSTIRSNESIHVSFNPSPSVIRHRWDNQGEWNETSGVIVLIVIAPMTEGNHFVTVQANDSSGEWVEKSWAFKIDNTDIFITLDSPTEYSTWNSGTQINISCDPTPVGALYAWDDNEFSALSRPLPEGDGEHVYHIQAEDSKGAWYYAHFYFYTDDTAPSVSLSETNNSIIPSTHKIRWDNPPEDLHTILYNWDNSANATPAYNEGIGYSFIVPLGSMWHELRIYTNDTINNEGSFFYRFSAKMRIRIESHPYSILITDRNLQTAEIYAHSNSSLIFDFSDTPEIVYYNWWKNDTHRGENSTTLNRTHLSGQKLLDVYANDSMGYWDHFQVSVNIDDTNPIVTSPWFANRSELLGDTPINFEISEPYLNQTLYSWDGASNSTDYHLPSTIGIHALDLYLQDWALNWNNYSYVYYTKYNVTLVEVANGSTLNGGSNINVAIEPLPVDKQFQWDSLTSTSTVTSLPVKSAWHTLNVSTQDINGKRYTEIFLFQTMLNVTMVTPYTNHPWQSIPVKLTFSETPLTVLYAWNDESYSTFIHDTPTTDGDHWFHVRVENSDIPSTSWFTYHFRVKIDNTPPTVYSVSHSNQSRINTGTELLYNLMDNACMMWKWDSESWSDPICSDETYTEVQVLTPSLTDGNHLFFLTLTDLANNTAEFRYLYLIDNTPSQILLNSPLNGSTIQSNCRINITYSETPVVTYYYIKDYSHSNSTTIPQIPYVNESITLIVYVSDGLNWNTTTYSFMVKHFTCTMTIHTP
ncbi:MAG: hypothetical protein ACW99Q_24470, partial [Candidatus Kariarchaeaceae archaeon]